ncbi:MAG: HNH endonuclease [Marinobacter sp.]|nr:HNH endonuclease [Marinobacter sp.]
MLQQTLTHHPVWTSPTKHDNPEPQTEANWAALKAIPNVRFATIPCTKSLFLEGTKHVVPLAWVWDRGAREWLGQKRRSIANDPVNLLPVKASLSKGAKGPDEWLPPLGECGYVARFVRVVKSYYLQPTAPELACL